MLALILKLCAVVALILKRCAVVSVSYEWFNQKLIWTEIFFLLQKIRWPFLGAKPSRASFSIQYLSF
jgi:hypothetical protein